jgi:hypothetical protein
MKRVVLQVIGLLVNDLKTQLRKTRNDADFTTIVFRSQSREPMT